MWNYLRPFLLLMLIVLLNYCKAKVGSTIDKSVSFDQYQTFAWEINPVPPIKYTLYDTDIFQKNLLFFTTKILQKKGLTPSDKNPDMILKYRIIVEDKKKVVADNNLQNTNPYYYRGGYGFYPYPYGGYGGGYGGYPSNTSYRVVKYKEGSLLIDVIDNKEKRLIWQGYIIEELDTPDALDKMLEGYLKRMFQKYPSK